ncbi:PfkB family carbohydrate kinase [Pseudomonas sp. NPDC088444]|uniref:PfkB family carbohydrate kinase n=1 Tax=Pseudomonas sp. NPDC088444 TaxID=3364456 RepID=UPI00384D3F66
MPARLLYTGQVVVDLVMALDQLPRSGGDVLARSAAFETGGGFNVMAAACRNGLQTVYLGRHGKGRFGDLARQAMAVEGIEVATVASADQDTGLSVALIEPSAERSFISYVGAEGGLSASDLNSLVVHPNDFVFVSGYSLLHKNKVSTLLSWLDDLPSGASVVFDPGPLVNSPEGEEMQAVLPLIGVWTSNCEEALRFTGCEAIVDALEQLARWLNDNALIVVRDGPNGCWIRQGSEAQHVRGFPVTAIDTNGAGDAHAGVLLAGLAAGLSPHEAALRANAAAAIAVTRWGPATAPLAAEVDQLINA